jgi:leucyl-tRNA synthetase
VHRFLKKLWRLFFGEAGPLVSNEAATPAELKALHKTIKKIGDDTERFSFNTCVSAFMVCVNELTDLGCHKKEILEPLLVILTPYARISRRNCGMRWATPRRFSMRLFQSWKKATWSKARKNIPCPSTASCARTINIDLAAEAPEVEGIVLQNEIVQKWLDGKPPKKIVFVKGKMVNVVV